MFRVSIIGNLLSLREEEAHEEEGKKGRWTCTNKNMRGRRRRRRRNRKIGRAHV